MTIRYVIYYVFYRIILPKTYFSGDTWERGRVLNSDLFVGTHTLMLVDTGYTAMTKSVAELPAIYFDIPAQVHCIKLSYIRV